MSCIQNYLIFDKLYGMYTYCKQVIEFIGIEPDTEDPKKWRVLWHAESGWRDQVRNTPSLALLTVYERLVEEGFLDPLPEFPLKQVSETLDYYVGPKKYGPKRGFLLGESQDKTS